MQRIDRERVLAYLIKYKAANDGEAPTVREIMRACGIASSSSVSYALDDLEAAGRIKRLRGRGGIRVVGGKWEFCPAQVFRADEFDEFPGLIVSSGNRG